MGQYHMVFNLDRREYLHPHRFGDGLKLMEFSNSEGGTMTALAILLAASNGRGGGDCRYDGPHAALVGSWAGDRIAIVGDYAEEDDLSAKGVKDAREVYAAEGWTEMSEPLRKIIESDGLFTFLENEQGFVTRKCRVWKSSLITSNQAMRREQ